MASKNLGAVIQRAISDGAFRRQLQSDPAAALRGFNLSPDEVAAIRSGDSGKLMSLGIDQRMSKAFAFSGTGLGGSAVRSSVADLNAGSTSNALTTDNAASRDGIIGDPGQASREAISTGTTSGTRAINDNPPFEGNVNAAAAPSGEFLGGDARLDPGTDSAHGFVPSDSADVQREMLDGHGDALGNTGGGGNTSS